MFSRLLSHCLGQERSTCLPGRRRPPLRRPAVYRPCLEILEDRRVPAAVSWTNMMGGDWDTASNWSGGHVPGANDDVTIGAIMGTVTHSQNVADSIRSLNDSAALSLTSGALTLSSNFPSSSTSTISASFSASNGARLSIQPLTSGGNPIPVNLTFGSSVTLTTAASIQPQAGATVIFSGPAARSIDASSSITGQGSVNVTSNTLTVYGTFTLTGTSPPVSTTTVGGGATLVFASGSTVVPGSVTVAGTVTFNGATTVTASGLTLSGTLNGPGNVRVYGGALTWTAGTMAGSGTTTLYGGVDHTISGSFGKTLAGGRTLEVRNARVTWSGTGGIIAGSTETLRIIVNGGEFIDATNAAFGTPGMAPVIENNWLFQKTVGTVGTPQFLNATLNNYGPLFAVNAGDLTLSGNANFTGDGCYGTIASGSTMTFDGGGAATYLFLPGFAQGGGTLGGGGSVVFASGTAEVDGKVSSGGGVTVAGGATLIGNGTVSSLTNNGTVAPGNAANPIATLSVAGDFVQTGTGSLVMQLASSSSYDVLEISGSASLDGALSATVLPGSGFVPQKGVDVFAIMHYASVTGDFIAFTGPGAGFGPVRFATFYNVQ